MVAYFVLVVSLVYYVGKGACPDYITGSTVYPAFLAMAALVFVLKIYANKGFVSLEINQVNKISLFLATTILVLYMFVGLRGDMRRFETGVSQYFGVFVFLLFFYPLFSLSRFEPTKIVKIFIVILSVEAIAEFIVVNLYGASGYLVHYDKDVLRVMEETSGSGTINRVAGLLGNRSSTAVFMVALFWLYVAFSNGLNWKVVSLLLMGFLACLSGSGVFTLLFSGIFYRRIYALSIVFLVVPSVFVVGAFSEYTQKISVQYVALMARYKFEQVAEFVGHVYEYPSLLFVGAPSASGVATSSDISLIKVVTDFGIAPLLLYLYLIYVFIKNSYALNIPYKHQALVRLSMLSLVVGTVHYPVLFSFPVQVFVGAMVAYSVYAKRCLLAAGSQYRRQAARTGVGLSQL